MDFQFETLKSSSNNIRFGAIQEDEARLLSYNADCHHPKQSQRDHSPSLHAHKQQRFQNFDPPAKQQHFTQYQRQASHSDLPMSLFSIAQNSSAQPTYKRVSKSTTICQYSEAQYNKAL